MAVPIDDTFGDLPGQTIADKVQTAVTSNRQDLSRKCTQGRNRRPTAPGRC